MTVTANATIVARVVDADHARRDELVRLLAGVGCDASSAGEDTAGLAALLDDPEVDACFISAEASGTSVFEAIRETRLPFGRVVLTHADETHAVRAFECRALDYLVMPATPERVAACVERVRMLAPSLRAAEHMAGGGPSPASTKGPTTTYLESIRVRVGAKSYFLSAADIEWVEADGNYSRLHVGGRSYLLRETLTRLAEQLSPAKFARVHRSALVGLWQVREMEAYFANDHMLRLKNGTRVRMSRRYRREFEARMRAFSR